MSQIEPTLQQQLQTFETHFRTSFQGTKDKKDLTQRMKKIFVEFQSILTGSQPTSTTSKKTLFQKRIGRLFRQIMRDSTLTDAIKDVKKNLPKQLEDIYQKITNSPDNKLTEEQKALIKKTIESLKESPLATKSKPKKKKTSPAPRSRRASEPPPPTTAPAQTQRPRALTTPAKLQSDRRELITEDLQVYHDLIESIKNASSPEQIPLLMQSLIINTGISWIDTDQTYKDLQEHLNAIQDLQQLIFKGRGETRKAKQKLATTRKDREKAQKKLEELKAALKKLPDPSELPPSSPIRETLIASRKKLKSKIKKAEEDLAQLQTKEETDEEAKLITLDASLFRTQKLKELRAQSENFVKKIIDFLEDEHQKLKKEI